MKRSILFFAMVGTVLALTTTSCDNCSNCGVSVTTEQFVLDSLIATQTSTQETVEFCADQLDLINDDPEVVEETSQTVGGITTRTVVTTRYTCD